MHIQFIQIADKEARHTELDRLQLHDLQKHLLHITVVCARLPTLTSKSKVPCTELPPEVAVRGQRIELAASCSHIQQVHCIQLGQHFELSEESSGS